jgi:hypothetical protein
MKFRFVDAATDELEEAINYSRANYWKSHTPPLP